MRFISQTLATFCRTMVGSGGRLSAAAPARERSLPPTSSGVRDAQGPHEARKAPAKVTTIQDTPYFTPAQCERLQARARGHHTSAAKWDQMRMAACSFIAAVGAKLGWYVCHSHAAPNERLAPRRCCIFASTCFTRPLTFRCMRWPVPVCSRRPN